MSAEMTEQTSYSWYCGECSEGGTDTLSEDDAAVEMDEHNEEQHG